MTWTFERDPTVPIGSGEITSDSWTYTRNDTSRNVSDGSHSTGAKTYRPMVELGVGKTVYREGGVVALASEQQGGAWDDLAWYLGDGGSVSVQKSIYKPCGSFVITIPDQPISPTTDGSPIDSLHALLEPVDGLKIYLARNAHEYAGGLPPILMRGFVRDIVRQEAMGRDGKPHRVTTVTGQDYGAVFDFLRLWMMTPGLLGIPEMYKALISVDIPPTPLPVRQFYQHFINFGNRYLQGLSAQGGFVQPLRLDCTVTEGVIPMIGVNAHEGPLWGWMLREMDSPWNELFIEDREDSPVLVYRPAPWKDIDGNYIPHVSGPTQASTVSIDVSDITRLTTHRSDYDAANLFWASNATAIQSGIQGMMMVGVTQGRDRDLVQDDGHQNNDRVIYGDRAMTAEFRQWPNNTIENPVTARMENHEANTVTMHDFWRERLRWLRDVNRDNVVFETGTLTCKGSEHIRPGMHLKVQRGSFEWECYITSVTHNFQPLQVYTTTVEFIRGTGFVERMKSGEKPYLREGKRGPYNQK